MDNFNQQQAEQNRRALFQKQQEQKQAEEKATEERQREEERQRKKRLDDQRRQHDERMQAEEKLNKMREEQAKRQDEQKAGERIRDEQAKFQPRDSVQKAREKFEYYKQHDPRWHQEPKKPEQPQRQKYDGIPRGAKAEIAKRLKVATPEEKRRLIKTAHKAQKQNKMRRQVDLGNANRMINKFERAVGPLPVATRLGLLGDLADRIQADRFAGIMNGVQHTDKQLAKQTEKAFKQEIKQRQHGRQEGLLEKASGIFDTIMFTINDAVMGQQQEYTR